MTSTSPAASPASTTSVSSQLFSLAPIPLPPPSPGYGVDFSGALRAFQPLALRIPDAEPDDVRGAAVALERACSLEARLRRALQMAHAPTPGALPRAPPSDAPPTVHSQRSSTSLGAESAALSSLLELLEDLSQRLRDLRFLHAPDIDGDLRAVVLEQVDAARRALALAAEVHAPRVRWARDVVRDVLGFAASDAGGDRDQDQVQDPCRTPFGAARRAIEREGEESSQAGRGGLDLLVRAAEEDSICDQSPGLDLGRVESVLGLSPPRAASPLPRASDDSVERVNGLLVRSALELSRGGARKGHRALTAGALDENKEPSSILADAPSPPASFLFRAPSLDLEDAIKASWDGPLLSPPGSRAISARAPERGEDGPWIGCRRVEPRRSVPARSEGRWRLAERGEEGEEQEGDPMASGSLRNWALGAALSPEARAALCLSLDAVASPLSEAGADAAGCPTPSARQAALDDAARRVVAERRRLEKRATKDGCRGAPPALASEEPRSGASSRQGTLTALWQRLRASRKSSTERPEAKHVAHGDEGDALDELEAAPSYASEDDSKPSSELFKRFEATPHSAPGADLVPSASAASASRRSSVSIRRLALPAAVGGAALALGLAARAAGLDAAGVGRGARDLGARAGRGSASGLQGAWRALGSSRELLLDRWRERKEGREKVAEPAGLSSLAASRSSKAASSAPSWGVQECLGKGVADLPPWAAASEERSDPSPGRRLEMRRPAKEAPISGRVRLGSAPPPKALGLVQDAARRRVPADCV